MTLKSAADYQQCSLWLTVDLVFTERGLIGYRCLRGYRGKTIPDIHLKSIWRAGVMTLFTINSVL